VRKAGDQGVEVKKEDNYVLKNVNIEKEVGINAHEQQNWSIPPRHVSPRQ
jgi:hypothetical protein